ncbi:hypothetical protein AX15_001208 [Amanita polypyramis BW_CC]|nr:hypothetical protein AX15_001208 [Amanita polypyramis BW_CC]
MPSLFAYSLLVVQLLVVRFVTAETYAIGNYRTNYWITDTSVSVGGNVRTGGGSDGNQPPADILFLDINPPPEPISFDNHTIYDQNTGLYIGLEEPISPGSRLKWVTEEYNWIILPTEGVNSYVISPPGQGYFWVDNPRIPAVIEVDSAVNGNGPKSLWRFKSSDSA